MSDLEKAFRVILSALNYEKGYDSLTDQRMALREKWPNLGTSAYVLDKHHHACTILKKYQLSFESISEIASKLEPETIYDAVDLQKIWNLSPSVTEAYITLLIEKDLISKYSKDRYFLIVGQNFHDARNYKTYGFDPSDLDGFL